jgi:hypothetical protein
MSQGILPIEYLIAAPLEALVRAQALAARTTVEFVEQVGFEQGEDGVSRARMLDFEYVHPRVDPDDPGNMVDTPVRVRVPALSLLPVPHVVVDEATVDLHLRVVGQQPAAETPSLRPAGSTVERKVLSTAPTFSFPLPPNAVRLVGTLTAPKIAEQTASLKVTIKLKQTVAPEGLNQILALLGEATTARPTREQ